MAAEGNPLDPVNMEDFEGEEAQPLPASQQAAIQKCAALRDTMRSMVGERNASRETIAAQRQLINNLLGAPADQTAAPSLSEASFKEETGHLEDKGTSGSGLRYPQPTKFTGDPPRQVEDFLDDAVRWFELGGKVPWPAPQYAVYGSSLL